MFAAAVGRDLFFALFDEGAENEVLAFEDGKNGFLHVFANGCILGFEVQERHVDLVRNFVRNAGPCIRDRRHQSKPFVEPVTRPRPVAQLPLARTAEESHPARRRCLPDSLIETGPPGRGLLVTRSPDAVAYDTAIRAQGQYESEGGRQRPEMGSPTEKLLYGRWQFHPRGETSFLSRGGRAGPRMHAEPRRCPQNRQLGRRSGGGFKWRPIAGLWSGDASGRRRPACRVRATPTVRPPVTPTVACTHGV